MREILFRGKRIDNGEWVYGVAFPHDNAGAVTMFFQHPLDGSLEGREVDPSTVGEYTSLTDKYGKKIFEGDIISDGGFTGIVVFDDKDDGAFLVIDPADPAGEADGEFFSGLIDREVCGNIYDNSELLEVEE